MAHGKADRLITALDIGSSKVSALIALAPEDGSELQVLGTGQRESKGVKRGYVADMERSEAAIREAVEQAERIARTNIEDVWVSFAAGGLVSTLASVEVDLGGHRIEQHDIDELLAAGRGQIDPDGRMVLHAQPTLYTIDGLQGTKTPLGLHADRLAVDIHVVAAEASPVRNIDLVVRSAHLEVKSIVASPIAAGTACLSDEERDIGVALVEYGAGVTNVSLFAGGMLVGLASIPMGAADITDDIASAFGTRRADAERLKTFYGSAMASPRDNHEMLDIVPVAGTETGIDRPQISRAQLIAVIRQQLEKWLGAVSQTLKTLGFTARAGRQIVLTGGGAELKGMAEYAQGAIGQPVRVGRPRGIAGLPDAHSGPAFSTLAGLVMYAASNPVDLRQMQPSHQAVHRVSATGLIRKMMTAFRQAY